MEQLGSHWMDFHEIWSFLKNLSRLFRFNCNLTRLTSTLHEDRCTFMISRWILLRMRNVSDRSCGENQNTHFVFMFCWPCISVYLSRYLTNLMHKICFTISFISCLYMFWAHVLIIRRSKLHYTASGVYFMPVHVSSTCAYHQHVKIALHSLWCFFMPLHVSSTEINLQCFGKYEGNK